MCTSCEYGKYLVVSDASKMTGSCTDKAAKSDSEDIIIYVSNLAADISRAEADQTGDVGTPYVDLYRAIYEAPRKAAPYSQKADGSIVKVRILLFTGDHYVIDKTYDWSLGILSF